VPIGGADLRFFGPRLKLQDHGQGAIASHGVLVHLTDYDGAKLYYFVAEEHERILDSAVVIAQPGT